MTIINACNTLKMQPCSSCIVYLYQLCHAIIQASDHNNAGEYANAKQCGNMALGCNICAIVKYVILLLATIAVVVVYFTVGFSWLIATKNKAEDYVNNHDTNTCSITSCSTDLFGHESCTQIC